LVFDLALERTFGMSYMELVIYPDQLSLEATKRKSGS
jgi:hypothetical protein